MLITPTTRQIRYFNLAKLASLQASHLRYSVGAVIVNGNYVVTKGSNKRKSHTRQHRYDKQTNYFSSFANIHAEICALIKSGLRDISGCEIYVHRTEKSGILAHSKPCCSCMQAIKDSGIKHVYFTSKDGYCYERVN